MGKLADDVEPSVRAELMEQVPHIAMYGQEYKTKLSHVVPQHLLPMVVKFLTDTNNQVRKTSQAALLVLLEQGLVERSDVQEQVCPVIIRLTEADSLDDYRTEAVALLSKMAPLIGKEMSEVIFLERFAALCVDPLFHVRKVCAANFGDFSNVVGSESTEQVLLPKFFYLCEDGVWGVRKACADVFMPVSCVCTPAVRQSELSPLFINLLRDQSRWVRMAAFQALGPFISTFADSSITALLHNDNGEIVITDAEQLAERLDQLEQKRAESFKDTTSASVSSILEGEEINSLTLEKENQLLLSSRKTESITYAATLSLEPSASSVETKSSSTSIVQSNLPSSTSLLSSASSSVSLPSVISPVDNSSTINENNNVDTSDNNNAPKSTDNFTILHTETSEMPGNLLPIISEKCSDHTAILSNNNSKANSTENESTQENSDTNDGDNLKISQTNTESQVNSNETEHEVRRLKPENSKSSGSMERTTNDMELVNLEEDEETCCFHQAEAETQRKINSMSHSKSDGDLSVEERRAELYKGRLNPVVLNEEHLNAEATVSRSKFSVPPSESFNDFHYWREPVASLDIEDSTTGIPTIISKTSPLTEDLDIKETVGDTKSYTTDLDLDDEIDDQVVLASLTGIDTLPICNENERQSNSFSLEDINVPDQIMDGVDLSGLEVTNLSVKHSSEADDMELIVEPLADSVEDFTASKSLVDQELSAELKFQLKLTSQSSELLSETETMLSDANADELSQATFLSVASEDTTLDKDMNDGVAFIKSYEGNESENMNDYESSNNQQSGEFRLDLNSATGSSIEQDQEESSMWQKCPVITFQTFDDLTDSNESSTMELFRPGTVQASGNISTFDPFDTTTTFRGGTTVDTEGGRSNALAHCDPNNSNANSLNPPDPALPKGPPATLQNIVPQLLVDHYVSMIDPSRAQTVDNEIARHCAFSLPAVALTLGRSNWPLLKDTYEALASDMQWKVRRTLASSIHELGIILGEEAAGQDLIPIFNGFLKDLDEVRIGLLMHLADFLKLLKPSDRKEYLPRLSEFLKMDNERNWRFRQELAEQIGHLVILFSPEEVKEHLSPIALVLLRDKVSAVRLSSVNVHTAIIKYLLHGDPSLSAETEPSKAYSSEDGPSLARVLLAELVEDLARVDRWTHRQTYALLCHHIFNSSAMEDSHFAGDVLQNLLELAWDKVPNVRLVVARALHTINQTTYFTTEANPQFERMEEAITILKNDKDPDVRAFFNPPPSLSICESTTEYFDSDGEPIGDVSSLPV